THAFFKALLFLGAGSVIHALRGEQDLRKMGGLAPRMVITTITMLIGAAGLAGFPPLAGFFSKDEILASAFQSGHTVVWFLLLVGAFMTAYYIFRLFILAFLSGPRMSKDVAHHAHEAPGVMTLPLVLLAVLTALAGCIEIPSENGRRFTHFLAPVFAEGEAHHGGVGAYIVLILSVVVVVAG